MARAYSHRFLFLQTLMAAAVAAGIAGEARAQQTDPTGAAGAEGMLVTDGGRFVGYGF